MLHEKLKQKNKKKSWDESSFVFLIFDHFIFFFRSFKCFHLLDAIRGYSIRRHVNILLFFFISIWMKLKEMMRFLFDDYGLGIANLIHTIKEPEPPTKSHHPSSVLSYIKIFNSIWVCICIFRRVVCVDSS